MRKIFLGFCLFCFCIFSCKNADNTEEVTRQDILSQNMDTSIKPGEDFFSYSNGGWIKANPIPPEESGWSIGNLVINENLERLRKINEKAVTQKAAAGTPDQMIGDFWKTAMDTNAIEARGIKPLEPWLDTIAAIHDQQSLENTMALLDRISVGGPLGFYIGQDAKNSEVYALQLWQTGLGLPDREYYFKMDSTSVAIRNAYRNYISKMLRLLGEDSGRVTKNAHEILLLETALARSHRKIEDLRDPYANYNKFAVKDLSGVSASINWIEYLQTIGAEVVDSVIIGQPEYYSTAGKLIQSTPLEIWKDYLRFRLADAYAEALPDAFGIADFEFSRLLTGAQERRPRWKRVIRSEENIMGELLGQLYVKEFFNATAKTRYDDLVENIREALKSRIENLDWMSDSTKQKALIKLSAMSKKVGYPDKWKDFSSMQIGTQGYVENLMHANEWWHKYELNKLGKPINKDEWDMYPQTYNAYYNPSNNEIVLPAGIFTVPGYRDEELDDAIVYGYAGASTIGHEITHGFDDEGRQFDEKGNLKNWWTQSDAERFNERAEVMVNQFNKFIVIDTFTINGKATLGENIADLGGILLGWDAFQNTEQFKKNEKINGLTPSQRYFMGYSLGWLSQSRPEQLRTMVLTDVHSPPMFRVNGPMFNVDAFYNVFNIKQNDKMYIPENERVKIW